MAMSIGRLQHTFNPLLRITRGRVVVAERKLWADVARSRRVSEEGGTRRAALLAAGGAGLVALIQLGRLHDGGGEAACYDFVPVTVPDDPKVIEDRRMALKIALDRADDAQKGDRERYYASKCALPTEWTALELLRVEPYNHDTSIFEFALPPGRTTLDLPTCACLLMLAPGCEHGGGDAVRAYTPISPPDMPDRFQVSSFLEIYGIPIAYLITYPKCFDAF